MAIIIDDQRRIFTLHTKKSTCQTDRGFSGNPYEMGRQDRTGLTEPD
ncbi:hypothetical protein AALA90_00695 [Lachnospiraceae bacterium 38-10]